MKILEGETKHIILGILHRLACTFVNANYLYDN